LLAAATLGSPILAVNASEIAGREKQKNMEDRSASNGVDADEYATRESEPEDWR
jgi:hypothetical protein